MTQVADWLKNTPPGHPSRSDLDSLLAETADEQGHSCMLCQATPDCLAMLETSAEKLLQKSCTLHVRRVIDFSTAAQHLAHAVTDQVITDDQLDHLMDLAPGGAKYLKKTGADQLRAELRKTAVQHPGPGPEWTWEQVDKHIGPDMLKPFMRHRTGPCRGVVTPKQRDGLQKGMLEAANAVLNDLHTYLSTFVLPAMLETRDPDQKSRDIAYLAKTAVQRPVSGPLWLPEPAAMSARLKPWLDTQRAGFDNSTRQQADTLKAALCPSLHHRQPRRGFNGGRELRDVVWEKLVEASKIPSKLNGAGINVVRLHSMTGQQPDRATLKHHNELWCMCNQADEKVLPRKPVKRRKRQHGTRGPTPVEQLSDVYDFFADYVEQFGRLPAYGAVNPDTAAAIEELTGKQYGDLIEDLVEEFVDIGWLRPSRSSNEQAMDLLVPDAFAATAGQYSTEWSEWEPLWRIDGMLPVDINQIRLDGETEQFELFLEADGEGHFIQVRNWDLNETRRRDIAKAEAIGLRARKQRHPCLLLALHHRCLTGRRAVQITPGRLAQTVHRLRDGKHWWAYVRPEGCSDERAAPGPTVTHPSPWPGLEILVLENPGQKLGEKTA